MEREELDNLLDGDDLLAKVDVKTLVLDLYMKHTSMEEICQIFYEKLPDLDSSYVKRFIYMKRN
jgi:hypothetical protein